MYATTVILHVSGSREHRNDGTEVQPQEGRVVIPLDHLLVQAMGRELAVAPQAAATAQRIVDYIQNFMCIRRKEQLER
jgi:hypothetical protein